MKITGLPLACGLCVFFASAFAVAQEWRGLGPTGAEVTRVMADPLVPGRVYAISNSGISRSSDAGRSWTPVGAGQTAGVFHSFPGFAADSQIVDRLYFFNDEGRMLRSDNGGLDWTATGYQWLDYNQPGLSRTWITLTAVPGAAGTLILTLPDGRFLKSTNAGASFDFLSMWTFWRRPVASLTIDPANPQHMLVGVVAGTSDEYGSALWRSIDGGVRWAPVEAGIPWPGGSLFVTFLGGQRVTAVVNGGLYFSADNGQSWQLRRTVDYQSIVVSAPVEPPRLILKDGRSCFTSIDNFITAQPCGEELPAGLSFQGLTAVRDGAQDYRLVAAIGYQGTLALSPAAGRWESSNRGLQDFPVRGLALQPGDSQRLFTGIPETDYQMHTPRLLVSSDGGQNWDSRIRGLARYVRDMEIDPTTAAQPGTTVIYAAGGSHTSSGFPYNSGIYKSSDGGATWAALDNGFPPNTASNGGVRVIATRRVKLDPRSCAAPPVQGPCRQGPLNTIYALTVGTPIGATVFKSTQAGNLWQPASSGLPAVIDDAPGYEEMQPADLEIDPLNGELFLGLVGNYFNDDLSPRVPVIRSGVFHSSDGGASWQQRSSGLPLVAGSATTTEDVLALAIHPRRSGMLWAVTGMFGNASRIYRSSDGGISWTSAGDALTGCNVRDLQIDSAAPDVLYAAGFGLDGRTACVLRSEDGGSNWTTLSAGLPAERVHDLRQDQTDRRRIVLATDRGIWEAVTPSDKLFTDTAQ